MNDVFGKLLQELGEELEKEDKRALEPPKIFEIIGCKIKAGSASVEPMRRCKPGTMVMVRPCDAKFNNKTYLGFMVGDAALSVYGTVDESDKKLELSFGHYNPLMVIPELGELVWGCGSWWGQIKNADQLRQITDADINNIWYIKALKQIEEHADQKTPTE